MHFKISTLVFVFTLLNSLSSLAQYEKGDTTYKECFVGSTLAMLGNFLPENKPDFVQLNLGYRITGKDVFSIEVKTWKYAWSLGIPYGESFEAPEEKFPGYIREAGFALVYQRFWWKGLYSSLHVMSSWQNFVNEEGNKLADGFQLFNTYRLGYHFKLFNNRFFIEPSLAITHRPYQSDMPESFRQLNDKWSKFFIGEPGLHFGYNF